MSEVSSLSTPDVEATSTVGEAPRRPGDLGENPADLKIRLSRADAEALKELAAERLQPVSAIIRSMVRAWIRKNRG